MGRSAATTARSRVREPRRVGRDRGGAGARLRARCAGAAREGGPRGFQGTGARCGGAGAEVRVRVRVGAAGGCGAEGRAGRRSPPARARLLGLGSAGPGEAGEDPSGRRAGGSGRAPAGSRARPRATRALVPEKGCSLDRVKGCFSSRLRRKAGFWKRCTEAKEGGS